MDFESGAELNKILQVKFNFFAQVYSENKSVVLDPQCNSITVVNKGEKTVTVNGIPLLPSLVPGQTGESIAIEGNGQEILSGRIDIVFAGAGTSNVLVIQKVFLL